MKLHPIRLRDLTLLESEQFIDRHLTSIRSLGGPEYFTDAVLNDYLEKLETCRGALSEAILVVRKSNETVKIEKQDEIRDQAISFLQRGIAFYEISEIEEERDAARSLKNLLSTYKNLATLNYEAESAGIDHLLSDLASSRYVNEVEFLNLGRCANRLQESNAEFKRLFSGRSEETMQQVSFDAKSLKNNMLSVYGDFAVYVLAQAKVETVPTLFTSTLSAVNATRKYYADMLARRKGVAAEAE